MRLRRVGSATLLGAALVALGLSLAPAPASAFTEAEASQLVAERFGVQVLKVRPGTVDGRRVWLVTAMNPGSDSNSAFVVSTVAVDAETGEPLRNFQPIETGSLSEDVEPAAEDETVTGTPPGPDSREPGDSGVTPQ